MQPDDDQKSLASANPVSERPNARPDSSRCESTQNRAQRAPHVRLRAHVSRRTYVYRLRETTFTSYILRNSHIHSLILLSAQCRAATLSGFPSFGNGRIAPAPSSLVDDALSALPR